MMVVVSYDVSTVDLEGRRRLRRVARVCMNWGQRVQNSVFECVVDPAQWATFRQSLLEIYDADQDSLRFYFMGAKWRKSLEHHGIKKVLDLDGPLIA